MNGRNMSSHEVSNQYPVIIVGGGQAGLAMSYCLRELDIAHVVLEKNSIAHAWSAQRWDSFCLVTPNWQCNLPGHHYAGEDPDGFMLKDQIVDYVQSYARRYQLPVREGVQVQRVFRSEHKFSVETNEGRFEADHVVMACGGYHTPKLPPWAAQIAPDVLQIDVRKYRNPGALPDGAVMVVGSGQSGCQIAEDLHLAGREVHLCVGSAPRVSRRYRGKDVVAWLDELGHYTLAIDKHPDGVGVRKKANHYVTGRDGGRDIDLRKFAKEGMQLHGRLIDVTRDGFEFDDSLELNLDRADATSDRIKNTIDAYIERTNASAPSEPRYEPVWRPGTQTLRLSHADSKIASVIWCMGFALDYGFVELPAFEPSGYPLHTRGITPVDDLYFIGLPWLNTWGSGRFCGVGADAQYLAENIASRPQRQ
jgi:putative flavoprotein involved in K+ transport